MKTTNNRKQTFCPVPWIGLGINNNGDFRMCVQSAANRKVRGMCKNSDGDTMHIEHNTISDARNSAIMKETRADMIAGIRSEHCVRCNKEDDSGMISRRQIDTQKYQETINEQEIIKYTDSDGNINVSKVPLLDLDLRLDNICNLRCRMCGPTESHQWYTEWMKTTGYTGFKSYDHRIELKITNGRATAVGHNPYSWTDRVNIIEILEKDAPELETIYMSGGEPLLIDQHYELLAHYIDTGKSNNMSLYYNTNFTNIPDKIFPMWEKFSSVNVGGSIDAIGELNDYIRYPSKWKHIVKNIHKLDRKSGDNTTCWITFTWQILNATTITNLFEFMLKEDFSKISIFETGNPWIAYHPVHNPIHYCLTTLPKDAKIYVEKHFNTWIDEWLKNWFIENTDKTILYDRIVDTLKSMIKFMNSANTSEHLDEFVRITKILDDARGQSFGQLCPELYKYIHLAIEENK